jgi:hypothetical protein
MTQELNNQKPCGAQQGTKYISIKLDVKPLKKPLMSANISPKTLNIGALNKNK